MDFQKPVDQDLRLHWQKPEIVSTVHPSDVYEGPTMCPPWVSPGDLKASHCVSGLVPGIGHLEVVPGHPGAPQLMEKGAHKYLFILSFVHSSTIY